MNGGPGNRSYTGGLVGVMGNTGETTNITASYATGNADGGAGIEDNVGGLVGWQRGTSTITASYATGNANGGAGVGDSVGRLVGQWIAGTSVTSYGFGTRAGQEADSIDSSQATAATMAAALTAGAAAVDNANAGNAWNAAASGTLGAWGFGDSNQPPALRYNDYDGDGMGTDYCSTTDGDSDGLADGLFTGLGLKCGGLLPGQRRGTTPQFGTTSSDIQLTDGDTPGSVTANITLPTSIMVGGNTINLMWSVFHDPEATDANKVTIGGGQLIVNAGNRRSTRRVILRATLSGGTIVNDYPLRVIQNP